MEYWPHGGLVGRKNHFPFFSWVMAVGEPAVKRLQGVPAFLATMSFLVKSEAWNWIVGRRLLGWKVSRSVVCFFPTKKKRKKPTHPCEEFPRIRSHNFITLVLRVPIHQFDNKKYIDVDSFHSNCVGVFPACQCFAILWVFKGEKHVL